MSTMIKVRLVVLLLVLVLNLSICDQAALAATSPVSIEGTILVTANNGTMGDHAYFLEGMSDSVTLAPGLFLYGRISPYMDKVAYSIKDAWPATVSNVWTAGIDGAGAVNLTLGLGGVSCQPSWSPDEQQIAFQHADPTPTLTPCEVGFHVWVMNADGTNAHSVMAEGGAPSWNANWSPDASRLVFTLSGVGAIAIDADGADQTFLPEVAGYADWSPDGANIVSATNEAGVNGIESGMWRRLVITDASGNNRRVLFEHFISDVDIATHLEIYGSVLPSNIDQVMAVKEAVGPSNPLWSPTGSRILFRAAYPFDPNGIVCNNQVELWLCDAETGELTQITDNSTCEYDHSWDGDNTLPEDPEVVVNDLTVTFPDVTESGVTTIVLDKDPPNLPVDYLRTSDSYQVHTTAQTVGATQISMVFAEGEVPLTAQGHLNLLRYDEGTQQWEDITVSRDTVNNVITGETATLGLMGLALPLPTSHFSDVSSSASNPYWALWEIEAVYVAGIVNGYPNGTYGPTTPVTRDQMAVYISRALAGNVPVGPATATFGDVLTDHWAYRYVEYCYANGVVQGYNSTTYVPDEIVDRAQIAVYMSRAVTGGDSNVPDGPTTATFNDVPTGYWAYKYIEYCKAEGIVQGYDPVTYAPETVVTRAQMAVYVQRAFDLPM